MRRRGRRGKTKGKLNPPATLPNIAPAPNHNLETNTQKSLANISNKADNPNVEKINSNSPKQRCREKYEKIQMQSPPVALLAQTVPTLNRPGRKPAKRNIDKKPDKLASQKLSDLNTNESAHSTPLKKTAPPLRAVKRTHSATNAPANARTLESRNDVSGTKNDDCVTTASAQDMRDKVIGKSAKKASRVSKSGVKMPNKSPRSSSAMIHSTPNTLPSSAHTENDEILTCFSREPITSTHSEPRPPPPQFAAPLPPEIKTPMQATLLNKPSSTPPTACTVLTNMENNTALTSERRPAPYEPTGDAGDPPPSESPDVQDEFGGGVIGVTCGDNRGRLHLSRLTVISGERCKNKCVEFEGAWFTPSEFQQRSGRGAAKDWKRTVRHGGRCLKMLLDTGLLLQEDSGGRVCGCAMCEMARRGQVNLCDINNDVNKVRIMRLPETEQKRKKKKQTEAGAKKSKLDSEIEKQCQVVKPLQLSPVVKTDVNLCSQNYAAAVPRALYQGAQTERPNGAEVVESRDEARLAAYVDTQKAENIKVEVGEASASECKVDTSNENVFKTEGVFYDGKTVDGSYDVKNLANVVADTWDDRCQGSDNADTSILLCNKHIDNLAEIVANTQDSRCQRSHNADMNVSPHKVHIKNLVDIVANTQGSNNTDMSVLPRNVHIKNLAEIAANTQDNNNADTSVSPRNVHTKNLVEIAANTQGSINADTSVLQRNIHIKNLAEIAANTQDSINAHTSVSPRNVHIKNVIAELRKSKLSKSCKDKPDNRQEQTSKEDTRGDESSIQPKNSEKSGDALDQSAAGEATAINRTSEQLSFVKEALLNNQLQMYSPYILFGFPLHTLLNPTTPHAADFQNMSSLNAKNFSQKISPEVKTEPASLPEKCDQNASEIPIKNHSQSSLKNPLSRTPEKPTERSPYPAHTKLSSSQFLSSLLSNDPCSYHVGSSPQNIDSVKSSLGSRCADKVGVSGDDMVLDFSCKSVPLDRDSCEEVMDLSGKS